MAGVERRLRRETQCSLALEKLRAIAGRPVRAIELAETCHMAGITHETKRRRVRELIEALHAAGHRVCASSGRPEDCGYWLARDAAEWEAYRASRQRGARFEFAAMRDAQNAAVDRGNEQRGLFGGDEEHRLEAGATRKARTAWATA